MVHSALIAHHSKPLGVLVNGNMSEAKGGCTLLEDVDEGTFVRFSQYAYTGDYIAADPDIIRGDGETPPPPSPSEPDPCEPSVANDDESWGYFSASKKNKKTGKLVPQASQSKKYGLWDNFKNASYAISPPFQPRKNRESWEDYTEVFLCHAKLYVFADMYDIGPLRDLSLHKLQRTLAEFTLYDQRVEDIVRLLRYSYSNTTHHPGSVDNLRSLVVHYSACVVDELWQSVEFQSLLEEMASFGRDLIKQMLKRLD